ncbi:MAG: sigma-54-dependent Fis family transcriptional regulator [Acidobacteria bacterium]|nr:sigma-54-dependent Fis family transcriptional regulator [Acidobacteriota bacterium]
MTEAPIRFLVVDDQQSIRRLCITVARNLGFECAEAASGEDALRRMECEPPDVVLADLRMENMDGLDFLAAIKRLQPATEVTIMTGFGSVETAVHAMKLGAYDYITKPFRLEELTLMLQRMAERVRLLNENRFLRERMDAESELNGIVGNSSRIQDVLRMVARLKEGTSPVLICGESGTGKELVARAIHFGGALASRPFIAVDCGSLVPTLVESELFGYERGAFTGAVKTKQGLFEAAHRGTLFLDEVGELPLEMQAKLLRALQEKEIRRVGGNQPVPVCVRVIAATNRNLEAAYQQGTFRKDLYFRLNVVAVHLPTLRERKSDIPLLVHWFLDRHANGEKLSISDSAMAALVEYDWPGNVRELENSIEHALALRNSSQIDIADLPPTLQPRPAEQARPSAYPQRADVTQLEQVERVTIARVFEQVQGDKQRARQMLGISRATLYRKLKRYHIGPFSMPPSAAS